MNKIGLFILVSLFLIGNIGCNNDEKVAKEEREKVTKKDTVNMSSSSKTIVFFGNSLTAGYGLDDPSQAFPSLIQASIDSLGFPYKVVNAGVSGETSSGGNSRIDWVLR